MKSIKKQIEELEVGCGNNTSTYDKGFCGEQLGDGSLELCNECETKLQLLKKLQKEISEEIDNLIKEEQDCMNNDEYEEQEIEHINQIEMADKIKERLGV